MFTFRIRFGKWSASLPGEVLSYFMLFCTFCQISWKFKDQQQENLDSHLSRKARPLLKCLKKRVNIVINKPPGVSP